MDGGADPPTRQGRDYEDQLIYGETAIKICQKWGIEYADVFNENDEFNGICFCLFDVLIAVISCLSIHKLAKVLNEFCFSTSKDLIALYKPIIPSCTISSFSAPIIKNLFDQDVINWDYVNNKISQLREDSLLYLFNSINFTPND